MIRWIMLDSFCQLPGGFFYSTTSGFPTDALGGDIDIFQMKALGNSPF